MKLPSADVEFHEDARLGTALQLIDQEQFSPFSFPLLIGTTFA